MKKEEYIIIRTYKKNLVEIRVVKHDLITWNDLYGLYPCEMYSNGVMVFEERI